MTNMIPNVTRVKLQFTKKNGIIRDVSGVFMGSASGYITVKETPQVSPDHEYTTVPLKALKWIIVDGMVLEVSHHESTE